MNWGAVRVDLFFDEPHFTRGYNLFPVIRKGYSDLSIDAQVHVSSSYIEVNTYRLKLIRLIINSLNCLKYISKILMCYVNNFRFVIVILLSVVNL